MPRIILECIHEDTCHPEMWRGHHLPHIGIPIYKNMKMSEIKLELRAALRLGQVLGSNDDARLLSADYVLPEEEKRANKLTVAAYAAIKRMKPAQVEVLCPCGHGKIKVTPRTFFKAAEEVEHLNEDLAYFVFKEVESGS